MDILLIKSILVFIAYFILIASIFVHVCYILAVLQRNEYRFDRIQDYLKTYQGLKAKVLYTIFFLLLIFIIFIDVTTQTTALYLLLGIYALLFIDIFFRALQQDIQRPIWTVKIQILAALSIGIPSGLFSAYLIFSDNPLLIEILVTGLYLFALAIVLSIFLSMATIPLTWMYKKKQIHKAKQKMMKFPHLLVIGVTGSYGKTSVKEYLYQVLKKKFTVLVTPDHVNTEIGVAQIVLTQLQDQHEIFIVEMGAYKKGEIKAICDIVKPKIGVLTAIIGQHLSLFGSIENIRKAKQELIDALPENGLAVINQNSTHAQDIYQETKIPKKSYSTKSTHADLYPSDIFVSMHSVSFHVNQFLFKANVHGRHHVENLLPCIIIANYLGLTNEEIQSGFDDIKPIPKTMTLSAGIKNTTIIDDTYNVNIEGIKAAIAYMMEIQGNKKHVVLPSMRELGQQSSELHQYVAELITQHCDYLYYISKDFQQDIVKGAKQQKEKVIFATTNAQLAKEIKNRISDQDIILFESRGAESVMNDLKEQ